MKSAAISTPTVGDYDRIFEAEKAVKYPNVDAFEQRIGVAIERHRLESAARVLACPVKVNAPSWQHGRVLFGCARDYVRRAFNRHPEALTLLDIGTAKGFSALCLEWALADGSGRFPWSRESRVYSVDVLDPLARVRRNTIAEVNGYKTLAELLAPWPEAQCIHFEQSTGIDWLKRHPERIHVAFVDGKHTGMVVAEEGALLAERQQPGDVVMFDDVQIPDVAKAVARMDAYEIEYLQVKPERKYAIGVRR